MKAGLNIDYYTVTDEGTNKKLTLQFNNMKYQDKDLNYLSMKIENSELPEDVYDIVIDAGHGGSDPGKIGINNVLEKDINLQIAYKLKMFLEMEDIQVIMTRETEEGLYSAEASNKKSDDMKKRCEIIDKANPEFTISIHQNSYHEEEIHGAQVFYYEKSEEGKKIAEYIQKQLITRVEPENTRVAKANGSYYLLRKTEKPTVIVECGFLSNYEEAEKLTEDYYQEKLAWAIHMAVMELL